MGVGVGVWMWMWMGGDQLIAFAHSTYASIPSPVNLFSSLGVDVLHPGYGMLAESAHFALRCGEEGITFVGPLPETIQRLGDKTEARKAAVECGIPVVPGVDEPFESVEAARVFAEHAG